MNIWEIIFLFFFVNFSFINAEDMSSVNSIQEITNVEKIILLDSTLIRKDGILPRIIDHNVYVLYNYPVMFKDTQVYSLYKYAISRQKYKIILSNSNINKRDWIYDFYVKNDTLCLLLFSKMMLLKRIGHNYYLLKIVELKKPAHFLTFNKNKYIAFFAGLLRHKQKGFIKETYKIIFKNDLSEFKIYNFKVPSGLIWTRIRPRVLISIAGDYLLLSSANKYQFKIYNNLNKVVFDTLLKERIHVKKLEDYNLDSFIEKMSKSTIIRTVNFIDTNRILLTWTSEDKQNKNTIYKIWFDIWVKEKDNWSLKYDSLTNVKIKNDEKFDFNSQFIDRFFVENGYLITLNPIPFKIYGISNFSFAHVDSLAQQYFLNQGPRYSLLIRKIK